MRIATNTITQSDLTNIAAADERYFNANQVVTSGKKINKPSDDPVGISQALGLQSTLDSLGQFQSNASDAKGFVDSTTSALGSVTSLLQSARAIVVQGANSSVSADARNGLAAQINTIITSLAQVANTQYGNQYIFAGQRTTKPPFAQSGSTYAYAGGTAVNGDSDLTVEIAPGNKMVVNTPGDTVFNSIFSTLSTIQNDLSNSQVSQLSQSDLSNMDQVMSQITGLQAAFGSKSQTIQQVSQQLTSLQTSVTSQLSNVQDADIPTAIVNLQTAQTAYQAALEGTVRSFQQSLVDYLH